MYSCMCLHATTVSLLGAEPIHQCSFLLSTAIMCSQTILELKKTNENILVLQENIPPYSFLEKIGTGEVRVILAIGRESKRTCLRIPFGLHTQPQHDGVSLIPSLTHTSTVLLDCEMHLLRHSAISRLPDNSLESQNYYILQNTRNRVCEIAYSLYHQIFLRFSDMVLIFVSDFGGIFNVMDMFCFWIGCALEAKYSPEQRNCINLILGDQDVIDESTFWAELGSVMVTRLRRRGIMNVNSAQVIELGKKCFDIKTASQRDILQRSWPSIISPARRKHNIGSLSALQWKYLFQVAVVEYSQQPNKRFDIIAASRTLLPLPVNATKNLNRFLKAVKIRDKRLAFIIGSALVMNAFPPNMCCKLS